MRKRQGKLLELCISLLWNLSSINSKLDSIYLGSELVGLWVVKVKVLLQQVIGFAGVWLVLVQDAKDEDLLGFIIF